MYFAHHMILYASEDCISERKPRSKMGRGSPKELSPITAHATSRPTSMAMLWGRHADKNCCITVDLLECRMMVRGWRTPGASRIAALNFRPPPHNFQGAPKEIVQTQSLTR